MVRPARLLLLVLIAAPLIAAARAQTAGATTAATAEPAPAPLRLKHERPISDSLASALAASMPKYNPPPKPKPEDADVDLRDVDKPRNGIIRLPRYVVHEKKPPVFRERDIYTGGGLADLAKSRYLTPTYRLLNNVYIPFFSSSPEQRAMAMYAEDERLNNISDLTDSAKDVGRADPEAARYLKRVTDETYMRSSGFDGYRQSVAPDWVHPIGP